MKQSNGYKKTHTVHEISRRPVLFMTFLLFKCVISCCFLCAEHVILECVIHLFLFDTL